MMALEMHIIFPFLVPPIPLMVLRSQRSAVPPVVLCSIPQQCQPGVFAIKLLLRLFVLLSRVKTYHALSLLGRVAFLPDSSVNTAQFRCYVCSDTMSFEDQPLPVHGPQSR